jgi:hypothetical protein
MANRRTVTGCPVSETTDPAFEPAGGEGAGSRDYADVEEAARQLGSPAPLPGGRAPRPGGAQPIRPIEETEQVAAAVDDEAPVPEMAQAQEPGGSEPQADAPSSSRSTRSE